MEITCLNLGICSVNTYIVSGNFADCVIIDPGDELEKIEEVILKKSYTPRAILLTHGHFDHIGEVNALRKKYSIPVFAHKDERAMLEDPSYNMSDRFCVSPISVSNLEKRLSDGDEFSVAGLEFSVMHTPGHSPGCVVYRCEDSLFTGDTLFDGCSGRWDFQGGDREILRGSLENIFRIKENLKVYPGHNNPTTLDKQRGIYKYFL